MVVGRSSSLSWRHFDTLLELSNAWIVAWLACVARHLYPRLEDGVTAGKAAPIRSVGTVILFGVFVLCIFHQVAKVVYLLVVYDSVPHFSLHDGGPELLTATIDRNE